MKAAPGRIASRLAGVMFLLGPAVCQAADVEPDRSVWVPRIEIVRLDGLREFSSGVAMGNERTVTNCHVVREADSTRVVQGRTSGTATMTAGEEYRDLCFLTAPGYPATAPPIAAAEGARVGPPSQWAVPKGISRSVRDTSKAC